MNDAGTWLWAALGALVVVVWLIVIVLIVGLLAFAGRRRALRRGTIPLHLLPWYLGGPPNVEVNPPDETRSRRKGARRP